MKNRLICAARSAWYGVSEPYRLHFARMAWWEPPGPLVSVIVPTFNRRDLLLTRALPSVLAQTYSPWELIVAAHGCTDGTNGAILAEQVNRAETAALNRVRLVDVPRRPVYPPTAENHWLAGPVDPINAGLKAARGDWIARIDDDDTWTPDHIENLLAFAQAGDFEFVSSAHATHEGKVVPYDLNGVKVGGTQTWLYRSYLCFFKYNRDCWRKRIDRVNDTDVQRRMRNAGVRMGYLDEITAHVLPRPGENVVGLKAYQQDRIKKERNLAFAE